MVHNIGITTYNRTSKKAKSHPLVKDFLKKTHIVVPTIVGHQRIALYE